MAPSLSMWISPEKVNYTIVMPTTVSSLVFN